MIIVAVHHCDFPLFWQSIIVTSHHCGRPSVCPPGIVAVHHCGVSLLWPPVRNSNEKFTKKYEKKRTIFSCLNFPFSRLNSSELFVFSFDLFVFSFDFWPVFTRNWPHVGFMANRSNFWTITSTNYTERRGEAESGLMSVTWQIDRICGRKPAQVTQNGAEKPNLASYRVHGK